jgi:thiamine-monophosphate kinase
MTTLRDLGELALIQRLVPKLATRSADLIVGPGEDDVAAWREPDGSITIFTADTFVEGVHFDPSWMPPETAGWRAVALSVSDLAAKGAAPTFGLVSLSAPPATAVAVVEALYDGMGAAAAAGGLRLVGGDTTHTEGPLTITIAALGRAAGVVHPRSEARAGWLLGVTGPLGGEAMALAERRPTRPLPKLQEGRALALAGAAAGDISDGLLRELTKFSLAAGLGARVRVDRVPRTEGATLEQALEGGEEVELLAAGEPRSLVGCTVIGELTADRRILLVDPDGGEREVSGGGYDHFR